MLHQGPHRNHACCSKCGPCAYTPYYPAATLRRHNCFPQGDSNVISHTCLSLTCTFCVLLLQVLAVIVVLMASAVKLSRNALTMRRQHRSVSNQPAIREHVTASCSCTTHQSDSFVVRLVRCQLKVVDLVSVAFVGVSLHMNWLFNCHAPAHRWWWADW